MVGFVLAEPFPGTFEDVLSVEVIISNTIAKLSGFFIQILLKVDSANPFVIDTRRSLSG